MDVASRSQEGELSRGDREKSGPYMISKLEVWALAIG